MSTKPTPTDPTLVALLEHDDLTAYDITRFGYRQKRVIGSAVTNGPFEYTGGDNIDRLQHRLATAAGSRRDNHETYVVETSDPATPLCLWFHDWRLTVGTSTWPS